MTSSKDGISHPSEGLEFGVSALKRDSNHLENAQTHESFWEALKAENGTTRASSVEKGPQTEMRTVTTEDRRWSTSGLGLPRINSRALAAAQSEHSMSFRDGMRIFPKAIFWSACISLAIVGEGFDTSLINSFYAFETFRRSYGVPSDDGSYQIPTKWQASLNNGSVAGSVIGLLANGWLTERFGYRKTLIYGLFFLAGAIFLTFFAFNIETLLAGQILSGLPWGIFSTLAVSYAAEVLPLQLRGYSVASVNLCWLLGQIIAIGTIRGFLADHWTSEWSYRIPFGLQWVWILVVLAAAWFAPESPWYLVRKQRFDDAKKVLMRLSQKDQRINLDNVIAMMRHTDEVEKQLNNGKAERNDLSYFECFRGKNLRRTEIACIVFMAQNLCGLPLIGFAAYFYRQVGFSTVRSFDLTLGMHGLAIMGSLIALVLIKRFGRRQLYLFGLGSLFVILVAASTLGTLPETNGILWGQAGLVVLFIFIFDLTIGPLTYTLVAEMPSTRLRVNTIVLARISYNVCSLVTNAISVNALNSLSWNLQGKSNWIWSGTCLLCLIYCYFRVPETKGLTYHELDILFEKGANARKFSSIQKRLEETGYFGFYEQGDFEPAWR